MSPVLDILARRFKSGRAGQRADALRDVIIPLNDLLKAAKAQQGTARHEAIRELEALHEAGVLVLERYRGEILKVRLPLASEAAFFAHLGEDGPQVERKRLAAMFEAAAAAEVPGRWRESWGGFCADFARVARAGGSLQPFDRANPTQTAAILKALPHLLAWEGESLMRFASAVVFGDSKTLETQRKRIEGCLEKITGTGLAGWGILENDRNLLLHGPLTLAFPNGTLDLGLLEKPFRISAADLRRAEPVIAAARCLTVENGAMLHELAKRQSGVLLLSSGSEGGYANSAVVEFLRRLPPALELWHFGDTDPQGFDILRDLRARTERGIGALHMRYRPDPSSAPLGADEIALVERLLASPQLEAAEKRDMEALLRAGSKGNYEQESLGRPGPGWPFY